MRACLLVDIERHSNFDWCGGVLRVRLKSVLRARSQSAQLPSYLLQQLSNFMRNRDRIVLSASSKGYQST